MVRRHCDDCLGRCRLFGNWEDHKICQVSLQKSIQRGTLIERLPMSLIMAFTDTIDRGPLRHEGQVIRVRTSSCLSGVLLFRPSLIVLSSPGLQHGGGALLK